MSWIPFFQYQHLSFKLVLLLLLWSLNIRLIFFKGFFSFLIIYMCLCLKRVWVHDCLSDPLELSYRQLWVKCGCWEVNLIPLPSIHFSSPKTSLCHYCLFNSCSLSLFTVRSTASRMTSLTFRTEFDGLSSWPCNIIPFVACHAILWLTLCLNRK